jgi:hypothetical protein
MARLSGWVAGGSTGTGMLLSGRRDGLRWSGGAREGLDTVPLGDDRRGPRLGGRDLEGLAASAAHEPGGGVDESVAQGFRLCSGEFFPS